LSSPNSKISITVPVQNTYHCSSFRLTIVGINLEAVDFFVLSGFDIFGVVHDNPSKSKTLSSATLGQAVRYDSSTRILTFPFSDQTSNGLLNFVKNGEIDDFFRISAVETLQNSCIYNLICSDSAAWTSSDSPHYCYFSISFNSNWKFCPTGYRIKSADKYFPKFWKIKGKATESKKNVILDDQKNNSELRSPYTEKRVSISSKNM
jgi:hypothetical protein